MHFWMVFIIPQMKTTAMREDFIEAILRDSINTSMKNRSSVGFLHELPVDMDSILINGVSKSHSECLCLDGLGIGTGTELICIVAGVQRSDYSSNTAGREQRLRYVEFLHSLENMEFDLGILHETRSKKITAFADVYPLIFKWTYHAKFTSSHFALPFGCPQLLNTSQAFI